MKLKFIILLFSFYFSILNIAVADIYIITNKITTKNSITKKELAAIYLLKKGYWADGNIIIPLNLSAQSTLREQFSQKIFKRSTREMGSYWNKMAFQGLNPPLTQASEQAVLLFIQRVPNSVAYMGHKPNSDQVKVLLKLRNN